VTNGAWFAGSLPAVLADLRVARNAAAHGAPVDRERVAQLRGQLVGVGCNGTLLELAGVQVRPNVER
jgi:hypothetical protein